MNEIELSTGATPLRATLWLSRDPMEGIVLARWREALKDGPSGLFYETGEFVVWHIYKKPGDAAWECESGSYFMYGEGNSPTEEDALNEAVKCYEWRSGKTSRL